MCGDIHTQVCYNRHMELILHRAGCRQILRSEVTLSTWPISIALTEGHVAEAHSAVADNDKAGQAGELGVLHCHVSRQVCKAQHQSIICTHAHHILSAALLPRTLQRNIQTTLHLHLILYCTMNGHQCTG